jgi:hypothetical protein
MLSDLYTQKWEPMLFCIFKYSRIKIFVTGAPQSAHGQQIYSFPLGGLLTKCNVHYVALFDACAGCGSSEN